VKCFLIRVLRLPGGKLFQRIFDGRAQAVKRILDARERISGQRFQSKSVLAVGVLETPNRIPWDHVGFGFTLLYLGDDTPPILLLLFLV
jgi:hypothetical protein